jgi:hypothetical protein
MMVIIGMTAVLPPPSEDAALQANAVRLHHLHYTVADPAAAMNQVALTLDGTRVLLQGFGVGVRVETHYVLFDRRESPARGEAAPPRPADAFSDAAAWLETRGVRAPQSFPGSRLAAAVPREARLHHIAFVADDWTAVRAALAATGAQPVRESADAVMYRSAAGLLIELLGPTDLVDAYWCPMHPDIRSGRPGACPQCSMALVPIPPPRIGEYRLDVTLSPRHDGKGMSALRFVIRDPDTGAPAPSFAVVHERPLHLFIVDRGLDYFAHVHPAPAGDGTFELVHDAPPGEYMLIAEFLPHGGMSQMLQRAVVTPGYSGPLLDVVPIPPPGPAEQTANGVRIRLEAVDLAPRKESRLRFTITSAATGEPLRDLESYLGAPAHMLMVAADLTEAIHGHPEEQGPSSVVTFQPRIPTAGTYKLWVQFQRAGTVITAPFVIQVNDR